MMNCEKDTDLLPSAQDGGEMPTAAQMKAARMLLGWSGDDLAKKAGVSLITVRRAESSDADQKALAYRVIVRAIEDAGIVFFEDEEGPGVRLRRKAP
jgi:transcriptional regulator with XRE-family HTH domain